LSHWIIRVEAALHLMKVCAAIPWHCYFHIVDL